MTRVQQICRRGVVWAAVALATSTVTTRATAAATTPPARSELPPSVRVALNAAHLPATALSVVVEEVGTGRAVLTWQPDAFVAPASLMKLPTTAAALDLLGPAWTWSTPVWLTGRLHDGVLEGDLSIRGSGDPSLVLERLWLLLRRVQLAGVRQIHGDIVLDHSAFAPSIQPPGAFDGEPLRPYNVQPDALLFNFKALQLRFVPDAAAHVAHIVVDPDLPGVRWPETVPLADGPCNDAWRDALRIDWSDADALQFRGAYAAQCGERTWPVAFPEPASYDERLIATLWRGMGGLLDGSVRSGAAPADPPAFTVSSPPLSEVVRDIDKYSNNPMAEQLFLTLGSRDAGSDARASINAVTPDAARNVLRGWLVHCCAQAGAASAVIDNGSGLSRSARLSARLLAAVLQWVWAGNWMPELMAALPISGTDGTLQGFRSAPGRAHLKTGSLRDAQHIAGYVLGDDGRRYVVVALVTDPNAAAAKPVLDALVQWVAAQRRAATERPPQPPRAPDAPLDDQP